MYSVGQCIVLTLGDEITRSAISPINFILITRNLSGISGAFGAVALKTLAPAYCSGRNPGWYFDWAQRFGLGGPARPNAGAAGGFRLHVPNVPVRHGNRFFELEAGGLT